MYDISLENKEYLVIDRGNAMGKLAVIEIGDGDFEHGFSVTIKIGEEGQSHTTGAPGKLPAKLELPELYKDWRESYRRQVPDPSRASNGIITNYSIPEIIEKGKNLKAGLNEWLNSQAFHTIKDSLQRELSKSEEIRVIIQTDIIELQQLPWHLWDIFDHYRKADVGLSPRTHAPALKQKLFYRQGKIRLLATFGCVTGKDGNKINTEKDREFLQKHLGDIADLYFLEDPGIEVLNNALKEYKPDIFFYAGHSSTDVNGQTGQIDSKRIEHLEFAFRKAVEHGLKLAIFNSCEGLGIARDLAILQIPQIIIMREPIPDKVAHEFLKSFLEEFIDNKQSLYLALREARESLQHLEENFPCATWLPVIFQDLTEIPPTWNDLQQTASENSNQSQEILDGSTKTEPDQPSNQSWIKRYLGKICIGAAGLIILGGIMGVMVLRNQENLTQIAKNNTVSIKGKNQGSGVIFAKKDNDYYVLTAKSVVNPKDQYKIVTVDREEYSVKISQKLSGIDFVILQFTSAKNYSIARLANSDTAREGTAIFLSGWSQIDGSEEPSYYHFIEGEIASLPRALRNGYTLIYDSNSREGMIGGPLIDAHGCVIGIHARPETEALRNLESAQIGLVKNGFNQGIPMRHILEKISEPELENDLGRVDKDCR
jgi:hypothetical protein